MISSHWYIFLLYTNPFQRKIYKFCATGICMHITDVCICPCISLESHTGLTVESYWHLLASTLTQHYRYHTIISQHHWLYQVLTLIHLNPSVKRTFRRKTKIKSIDFTLWPRSTFSTIQKNCNGKEIVVFFCNTAEFNRNVFFLNFFDLNLKIFR